MHALPAFLETLTASLTAALGGVQVVDGPPVKYIRAECVAVGITTEDASVESTTAQAGLRASRESVDVINLIRVWSGNSDLTPLRVRAYQLLDVVDQQLRADPTVADTVAYARLIGHVYTPARTEEGVGVFLEPRIRVDAFLS